MERIYKYLKKCGVYFLATCDEVDERQPRVRPFGTIIMFDGKLCFQTGKKKPVSRQIHNNPRIEICAHDSESQTWLRLTGVAVEEPRIEAQRQTLEAYPELKGMYQPGDGITEIFKIEHGNAVLSSFSDAPTTIIF